MKTVIASVIAAVGSLGVVSAQSPQVEIDDLRAPTSPAFVLLDVTPASVERPETPKSFSVNVINAVSRSKGLPQNYALEVAPYWLTSHPDLTFDQYQSPGLRSVLQTFAISVATTPMAPPESSATDVSGSHLGLGLRTTLLSGRFDPKLNDLVDQLADIQGRFLDADNAVTIAEEAVATATAAVEQARDAHGDLTDVDASLKTKKEQLERLTTARDAIEGDATAMAVAIEAMDARRLGFIVTVAAAKTWDFPSDDIAQYRPGRWGVWLTPTYRFRACTASSSDCATVVDAVAVVRTLREPGKDLSWDVGGRMIWQPTKELSVSAEVLRRRSGDGDTTVGSSSNRTTGMLEYRIRDDLSLYGSFGRDFQKDTGQKPLVSLMGLNVGLGQNPTVKTK